MYPPAAATPGAPHPSTLAPNDHVAVISLGITGELYASLYNILEHFGNLSKRTSAPLLRGPKGAVQGLQTSYCDSTAHYCDTTATLLRQYCD